MKKIGFFGGTFDPPHFGHENLALSLKEQVGLDHILVCPTNRSPLKEHAPTIASSEQRLQMVKKSLGVIPGFEVVEDEIHQDSPVYTIDTISKYLLKYEGCELFLLLGMDHLELLPQWKDFEKLCSVTVPIFGARPGTSPSVPEKVSEVIAKKLRNGVYTIPQFDISATDIRHRLAEGLYCGHLVQSKVLDFIFQHSIYLSN